MRITNGRTALLALTACLVGSCGGASDGGGGNDPAAIVIISGEPQTGDAGYALPNALIVRVDNADGEGMPDVQVTWVVTSGSGSVDDPTTQTDASGHTQVTWTLSPSVGAQTVEARVSGVTAAVFHASALTPNPCNHAIPYSIGAMANGTLASSDCALSDNSFIDYFGFNVSVSTSARFTLSSGSFDTFLYITDEDDHLLAVDDDGGGGTNSSLHILLGPGSYRAGANSYFGFTTGPYSLTSALVSSNVTACADIWATPGLSTSQALTVSDCVLTGPAYADGLLLVLQSGQTITVAMNSSALDPYLILVQGSTGYIVDSDDDGGPGVNALMTYTAATLDVYALFMATALNGQTGNYTLTIQ